MRDRSLISLRILVVLDLLAVLMSDIRCFCHRCHVQIVSVRARQDMSDMWEGGFSTHERVNIWAVYSPQAKICGHGPTDEERDSALDVTQKWPESKRDISALLLLRYHHGGATALDAPSSTQ